MARYSFRRTPGRDYFYFDYYGVPPDVPDWGHVLYRWEAAIDVAAVRVQIGVDALPWFPVGTSSLTCSYIGQSTKGMARPKYDYAEVIYCLLTGRPYIDDAVRQENFRLVHFVLAEAVLQAKDIRLRCAYHSPRLVLPKELAREPRDARRKEARDELTKREGEEIAQDKNTQRGNLNDRPIRAEWRESWANRWLDDLRSRARSGNLI